MRPWAPLFADVAQLVVQQLCKLKTVGSSPIASTICPFSSVVEHSPGTGEVASSILAAGSDLSMTRFIQIDRVASGENRTCSPVSLTLQMVGYSRFTPASLSGRAAVL